MDLGSNLALTRELTAEMLPVPPASGAAARAEAVALLRFGGGLNDLAGRLQVCATTDTPGAALRMAALLAEQFEIDGRLPGLTASGDSLVVRRSDSAEALARRVGLISSSVGVIVGMPPSLVAAAAVNPVIAAGALRGAVLARGRIEVNRNGVMTLYVLSPTLPAAAAAGGFARKVGAVEIRLQASGSPTRRELGDFAAVRDHWGLATVLRALGAPRFAAHHLDDVELHTLVAASQ